MQVNTYLSFNGNCEAAFQFYEQHLGGKIGMIHRYGESPMADQCPPSAAKLIMHMRMELNGQTLMGSDSMPDQAYEGIKGVHLSIGVNDVVEAERLFAALAVNAQKIIMPLDKTFWAARFGMLVDQFGVPWMVNCE